MPRYVVTTEIARTYRRSITRTEDKSWQDDFAAFLAAADFPSEAHPGWEEVDAGVDVVTADGSVVNDRHRTATTERTVLIARPIVIHAANQSEAKALIQDACQSWRPDMPPSSLGDYWYLKEQSVRAVSVRSEPGPVRARPTFEVDFQKVVAPDSRLCGLHEDEAFELFRWMVGASANYSKKETWYVHHAHMSMNGGQGTSSEVGAVVSGKDLAGRIVNGVLCQSHELYREWREDHGLTPTTRMSIPAPIYGGRANGARAHPSTPWNERSPIAMMEAAKGLTITTQLNPYHEGARIIQHLGVVVSPKGFVVDLKYGYDNEPCASFWHHELARSMGREPFVDVFDRAVGRLLEIVPDWDRQILDRRSTTAARAA
jgi:hypothetical protein